MTSKTRSALGTEMATDFADNTTGAITPAITRGYLQDHIDSTTTNLDQPTFMVGTSMPAGGSVGTGILMTSTANFGIFCGSGSPVSTTPVQGSVYLRTDGSSSSTRLYVMNSVTTWVAITTAS